MKRVICLILCVIFTLPLVSCSGSYGDLQLYNAVEIDLPDDISFDWQSLGFADGRLKLRGYDADTAQSEAERDNDKRKYTIYEYTGAEFQPCENQIGAESLASFELSSCICVVNAEFAGNHYRYMTIVCYGSNGDILAEYDCETLFDIDLSDYKRNSDTGLYSILCAAEFEDELYFVSSSGAVRIGNEITRVDSDKNIYFANLYDGELAVETADGIFTVDFDSGVLVDENLELPLLAETISLPGYLFGSVDNSIVSGWKRSGGKLVEEVICDLICTGITGTLNAVACETTETLYVSLYDRAEERDRLWRLDLIDDSERIELLTVAIVGFVDSSSISAIAEYNRAHTDTKLRVVRYEPVYDGGVIYIETAREAFEQDLADGRIPDIMVIEADTGAKLSRLAGDRLFCDLYELMDKNGFDKSGLLSGITSYELVEGQSDEPSLYYFPLEVSISTFVGRSSEFPDKLTLANFLDRLEQLGDDQCLIDYLRFRFALRCSLEEFIDYESGTTDFDSELFCRVAEAYREYGDLYRNKAEYGNSDSKWQALADGELLLTNFRLSINQLALCDAKYQLDDLTAVGYPDRDGSGILLEPAYFVGISADCENTDAAFEFLMLRLSDKYLQNSPNSIPYLTSDTLDTYFENLPRWYYFSPTSSFYSVFNERKSEDTIGYMFKDGYIEYYLSDELCELMRGMIDSAAPLGDMDDDILSIIMEELDTYKSRPDMSASDAAKIIDSRVSTYYNENKD